jgi:hypothetical protein
LNWYFLPESYFMTDTSNGALTSSTDIMFVVVKIFPSKCLQCSLECLTSFWIKYIKASEKHRLNFKKNIFQSTKLVSPSHLSQKVHQNKYWNPCCARLIGESFSIFFLWQCKLGMTMKFGSNLLIYFETSMNKGEQKVSYLNKLARMHCNF